MNLVHLCLILSLGILSACNKEDEPKNLAPEPVKINLTAKSSEVIGASNQFGLNLFREVALEETENMMLSPLSASVALTMLLNGAQNDTYHQIREMLGYESNLGIADINEAYQNLVMQLLAADERVDLSLANAIFHHEEFHAKAPFIERMQDDFDAEVQGLDFLNPASVDIINQWAHDNTNGKVQEILDHIDPEMVMFLMNALYFKGEWTSRFNEEATDKARFTLKNGEEIMVDAMYHNEMVSMVLYEEEFKAIELPFGRKNFSMMVVVPWQSYDAFLEGLTPELWNEITSHFDASAPWAETALLLPKFSFEYEKNLNDYLEVLGMVDAFYEGLADLSGISDLRLYVDMVQQNTFVEVNEEGAEAAAVTTIGIGVTSVPAVFMVDSPFVFAIRERTTNTLLFIGSVLNPAE